MKKILNIVGPQGCGKTTLAETIAAFIGDETPRVISAKQLCSPTPEWLLDEPAIVIVEGGDLPSTSLPLLVGYATADNIDIVRKGHVLATVVAPRFIVLSDAPIARAHDRRVLAIGAA
jgi:energy-coupling factor transporter ATP-binding protein EcfA2